MTQLTSQWSMNMIKVLWFRFQHCLGTFTMLLVEGSSQTGLFRQLSNHVFGVCNFEIQNLWGSSFLSKYLEFNLDLKNAAKNWEKVFFCRDNYIWIGIVKFSLLRTGYFSSAANVLTSSPKNLHVNNRDSFQLNWIRSDQGRW